MASPKPDMMTTLAFTWLFTAVGVTVFLGPNLGLRGWGWLLLHHALCAVGTSHELIRGWRRHKDRRAAEER